MRFVVIGAIATAIAIGAATQVGGGGPQTANVFVAANGSDTGTECKRNATPIAFPSDPTKVCLTFDKADSLLQNGDTALIKGGSYGDQTVSLHTLRSSQATMQVVTGDTATVGDLIYRSEHMALVGPFAMSASLTLTGANDNTNHAFDVTDVNVTNFTARNVEIRADHVTIKDGNVGPSHACVQAGGSSDLDGILLSALFYSSSIQEATNNITLDNITDHDHDRWTNGVDSSAGVCSQHTDGMQMFGGENITIKNSHFYRNATSQLLLKHEGSAANKLDHVLIQNTMFGQMLESGNEILIGDSPAQNCNGAGTTDVVFQNNTVASSPVSFGCTGTAAVARSNVLPGDTCTGGTHNATYTYDVFPTGSDASCTGTSNAQTCNVSYADANRDTNGNYSLNSSDTCAKDHGDPVNFPATDINGTSRPQGSAPDAAADEH